MNTLIRFIEIKMEELARLKRTFPPQKRPVKEAMFQQPLIYMDFELLTSFSATKSIIFFMSILIVVASNFVPSQRHQHFNYIALLTIL